MGAAAPIYVDAVRDVVYEERAGKAGKQREQMMSKGIFDS